MFRQYFWFILLSEEVLFLGEWRILIFVKALTLWHNIPAFNVKVCYLVDERRQLKWVIYTFLLILCHSLSICGANHWTLRHRIKIAQTVFICLMIPTISCRIKIIPESCWIGRNRLGPYSLLLLLLLSHSDFNLILLSKYRSPILPFHIFDPNDILTGLQNLIEGCQVNIHLLFLLPIQTILDFAIFVFLSDVVWKLFLFNI